MKYRRCCNVFNIYHYIEFGLFEIFVNFKLYNIFLIICIIVFDNFDDFFCLFNSMFFVYENFLIRIVYLRCNRCENGLNKHDAVFQVSYTKIYFQFLFFSLHVSDVSCSIFYTASDFN